VKVNPPTVASILAKTCVQAVISNLESQNDARQTLRLKNFSLDVYQEFINEFANLTISGKFEDIILRIPFDADLECDEKYRIAKDSTITLARNDQKLRKLVYLETHEGSDSQSTKDFFTIRDSDLLRLTGDNSNFNVVKCLVDYSAIDSSSQSPANALLIECLQEVLEILLKEKVEISTPKVVAFIYACTSELGCSSAPTDISSIRELVGRNFCQLDLFNDIFWYEKDNAIGARLKSNSLLSDLAKSDTQEMDIERELLNVPNTKFKDEFGEEYSKEEQNVWRESCVSYLQDQDYSSREFIPFFIFSQIFKKSSKGVLLGDLVRTEIIENSQHRESEFDNLGVLEGLNSNSQSAADLFLEQEADEERNQPLKDLLTKKTLKRVERLVVPKANAFFNPLIQIARVLTIFSDDVEEKNSSYLLRVELHDVPDEPAPTLGLFTFLYSRLLGELSVHSQETNSMIELVIDESLLTLRGVPVVPDEGSDSDWALIWAPLMLKFEIYKKVSSEKTEIIRSDFFSWLPETEHLEYLFLWWGLVMQPGFRNKLNRLQFPTDISGEQFRESFMLGHRKPCEVIEAELVHGVKCPASIDNFTDARKEYLEDIAKSGLHFDVMSNYVDLATGFAKEIRHASVPNDTWENEPYQFLASDVVVTDDSSCLFVLPSNAVKSRWISDYLRESYKLAAKSIQLEIPLNEENGDIYLSWIENLSSSQQPCTMVDQGSKLYESHSEKGWGEYMVPVDKSQKTDFSTESPEGILEVVCAKVRQYLHHHPHKIDGMTLTVVSKRDASFSSRLIHMLRKGEFSSLKVTVNLITLRSNFTTAMSHFDQTDVENRFSCDGVLFPHIELRLFEYTERSSSLRAKIENLETDIAIIPQLLEGGDDYHRTVELDEEVLASTMNYKPLYDAPVTVKDSGGSQISVPLKPEKSDELLDSWSTLVTRQKDLGPVSSDGSGCDYYEKKINFSEHAELFEVLHKESHWVITAERYLKREQLEFLKNKPEIISFKDGLGPGGNYSIIVSSNSGKTFVLSRLQKKLKTILIDSGLTVNKDFSQITSGVFDSAREITPELALDALGVARVSEEILGLSVARKVVDELPASIPKNGYTAWISLDSYKDWFVGGESSTRADMVKVIFDTSGSCLKVGIIVLESKLRKDTAFVEHALVQIRSTINLLNGFLSEEQKHSKLDAELWRDKFLAAIRNSGDRAISKFGNETNTKTRFNLGVGDDFRRGKFELSWIVGLTVQSVTNGKPENNVDPDTQDSTIWRIRVGTPGIIRSFDDLSILSSEEVDKVNLAFAMPLSVDVKTPEQTYQPMKESIQVLVPDLEPKPIVKSEVFDPVQNTVSQPASMSDQKELKERYQEVLSILSSKLNLPIKAADWKDEAIVEGPSSFLFRIRYEGTNPKDVEAKHDALKLNLGLDEDQSINFSIGGGFINIDVPKKESERYFVTTEDLWEEYNPEPRKLSLPLGVDRFGKVVVVHFSDSDSPHLLIGGTTGSGKSEALHTLLCGMCHYYTSEQIEMLLIDPKGSEMEMYQDTDYVNEEIAMFEEEALYLIDKAVEEMQSRFVAFRQMTREKGFRIPDLEKYNELAEVKLPWLVLVIDEYADITSEKSFKKGFEDKVKRVAQKGRSAGVHLIIATQKPSAEVISTSLRANLPAQIALRVKGVNESRVIIEESGAEGLIGKGDSIFKSQTSSRRVQCGKVRDIGSHIKKT
jgi:hypothetical protein